MPSPPSISVIITTFNEEDHLGACLASVAWATEKIVVDGESVDGTREIAETLGARVFVRPNHLMLNLNKNFGFEQATCDWIMSLDSDERVPEALQHEIIAGLSTAVCDGYRIPLKNFFWGKPLRHAAGYPATVTRLCRRGKGRFGTDYVHQGLKVEGPVATLKSPLHHYPARNLYELIAKLNFNTSLTADYFSRKGAQGSLARACFYPVGDFLWRFFGRGAFLDGVAGFTLCAVRCIYMFVWQVKLWELQHVNPTEPNPAMRADLPRLDR